MNIGFILLAIAVVIGISGAVIFTNNKHYCQVFERKDWNLWETVLGKFEGSELVEQYTSETKPYLDNYKFLVTLDDGTKYKLIYWVNEGVCSVFDEFENDCILCDFDEHHSNMAVGMVRDKLGLDVSSEDDK